MFADEITDTVNLPRTCTFAFANPGAQSIPVISYEILWPALTAIGELITSLLMTGRASSTANAVILRHSAMMEVKGAAQTLRS